MSAAASESGDYAGLVTRAVALLVDAIVINVVSLILGAAGALIASLIGNFGPLGTDVLAAGGIAWVVWSALYFVGFWMVTGQTPGARLMGFRVVAQDGRGLSLARAIARFAVMSVCLIPVGAGFIPVLYDDRRRGPHDHVGHTAVRWKRDEPPSLEHAVEHPAAIGMSEAQLPPA